LSNFHKIKGLSHRHQRKEKDCLNCGTIVAGKYCQSCGQENAEPKDTVLGLVQHFIYDITHFDGMFFSSLKLLLFKPGMLTRKYIEGKRAGYLNPIKMYVFISAVFFVIFFTFLNPVTAIRDDSADARLGSLKQVYNDLVKVRDSSGLSYNAVALEKSIRETETKMAILTAQAHEENESLRKITKRVGDSIILKSPGLGIKIDSGNLRSKMTGGNGFLVGLPFANVEAYKLYQHNLPDSLQDKTLKKAILYRMIRMKGEAGEDRLEPVREMMDRFFHAFPQLLFISLPLFALILSLLYIRKKQYYYVDHVIFSIHLFCATFIFILLYSFSNKLKTYTGLGIFTLLSALIFFGIYFYQYKALRNFYKQSRLNTILSFIVLNVLATAIMTLLLAGLLIFAAFQV